MMQMQMGMGMGGPEQGFDAAKAYEGVSLRVARRFAFSASGT